MRNEMDDNNWWLQQEYLDGLQRQWKSSIPTERQREQLLLPDLTKTFLKDIIKINNQQCYDIIRQKSDDLGPPGFAEGTYELLDKRHQILLRRIREYTYRLRGVRKGSGTEITPDTIRRAKESPIQDYLVGWKCRRLGKTIVGKCPFHDERTGSFVIYIASNRWTCFAGCGNGDVIDIVMRQQNLKFPQAVRYILHL